MSDSTQGTGKELTGRKVLLIAVAFFGTIMAVNFFMASRAIGTFPGLEVKNSYVASQSFDAERKAQEALGWQVTAGLDGERVTLDIIGPDGKPARVEAIEATLGRATQRTDDQTLAFEQTAEGTHVAAIIPVDAGKWELRFIATAMNGVTFRQNIALFVPES